MADNTGKAKRDFEDIQKSTKATNDFIKEMAREFPDIVSYTKQLAQQMGGYKKLSDDSLDTLKKSNDLTREILGNRRDIHKESFATKDLSELEYEFQRKGLTNRLKLIQKLKEEQRIQKGINNKISASANMAKKFGDNLSNSVKNIPFIGDFLSTAMGFDDMGDQMSDSVRNSMGPGGGIGSFLNNAGAEFSGAFTSDAFRGKEMSPEDLIDLDQFRELKKSGKLIELFPDGPEDDAERFKKYQKEVLGRVHVGSRNIFEKFRDSVREALNMGGLGMRTALVFLATFGAVIGKGLSQGLVAYDPENFIKSFLPGFQTFRSTFGDIDRFSFKTAMSLLISKTAFGITSEDALKLAQAQTEISNLSIDQALAQQRTTAELARQRGVNPADVIKDMADNSQLIAEFTKDGGANLGLAAIEARKLGLSLGTTAKIADTLLDFESSIEKEMETSVLLGRQLNLERARQLAFDGETLALQKEVVKQVGSEAKLRQMSVIQRRSLASALGIDVQELNKIAKGEVEFKNGILDKSIEILRKFSGALVGVLGILTTIVGVRLALAINRNFFSTERNTAAVNANTAAMVGGGGASNLSSRSRTGMTPGGTFDMRTTKGKQLAKAAKYTKFAKGTAVLSGLPGLMEAGAAGMQGDMGGVASGVTQAAGGVGGAALGAAIGSFFLPGIGTAIGGVIGGLAGNLAGDKAGDAMFQSKSEEQFGSMVTSLEKISNNTKGMNDMGMSY